jgi:hypothetical protein
MQSAAEDIKKGGAWSTAKGIGKYALSQLQLLTSPISAVTETYIAEPVEFDTGSKLAGKVAQLGTEALIPGIGVTSIGRRAATKAVDETLARQATEALPTPPSAVSEPPTASISPELGPGLEPTGAIAAAESGKQLNLPFAATGKAPEIGSTIEIPVPKSKATPEGLLKFTHPLPDKITGLNLTKLNTTDDVKNALRNLEEQEPSIAAAQGGVVPHAKTLAAAKELFDKSEFQDFEKWFTKNPGEGAARIGAVKILLTRAGEETTDLANKALKGSPEDLVVFAQSLDRLLMIQQVVARGRAEAGRTLNALRCLYG